MHDHINLEKNGRHGICKKAKFNILKSKKINLAVLKPFVIMVLGSYSVAGWSAEVVDNEFRTISGSQLNVGSDLMVGYFGFGNLTIQNQAQVTSQNGYLGVFSGSVGQVFLTGVNASWINTGFLGIGLDGNGVVWVENGASVSSSDIFLADSVNSYSQINLNGTSASRGVISTGYLMKGPGTALFQWDGGILQARHNQANFFLNFDRYDIEILDQGAFFDTNGYDVGVETDLIASVLGAGVGGFTKLGLGSLTLSGSNSYSGGTFVNSGTLVANNNSALGTGAVTVGGNGQSAALKINSGIAIANSVTLNNGGALTGFGSVGSTTVESGGVLAPSQNGVTGALTVNGNLVLKPGAVYHVQVDPNSNLSSLVHVNGTATLGGSVLHVGNQSDAQTDFQVGKTYTILTANQVSGVFTGATSSFAYLDAKLDYSIVNQVNLELQRKAGIDFADLGNTSNQMNAAGAIESLPSTHPLYQYVETLPAGTPAAVFSTLSGDTHSSVMSSVNMLGAQAPAISQNHLRSNLTAGLRAGAPIAQSSGTLPASALPSSKALPAWVEVVGNWQRFNGNGNAPGLKQNTAGLFLGGDEEVGSSGWRVGGSVGYTQTDAKVNSRDASADISSYSAAVYTGKSFAHGTNRVNVLGGLAYTHHSIESERTVASLGQNLKADYSGHTAQLFAEVGYAMGQYDKQGFEPFVGITLGEQRTGSFQETGGFAALSSQSSSDTLASTTLGLRAHSDFKLAGKDTRVRGTLGVRHAWGSLSQNRTMAFEGSSSFTVAGAPLARNTALVGLQAEMELSRRAALVLGYNGEFGGGNRDHSANVKLRWAY
ncbi:UNVERIFIED_ORG: outer membrane autotransporter protein [Comamonas terrigena]